MHSLVSISTKRPLRPYRASVALLVALGCAGADEADDTPEFTTTPPAFGGAPAAPPSAAGSTTPPAPGAAPGNGAAGAPGNATPAAAPPAAPAPEGSGGNVPLTPAAPAGGAPSGAGGTGAAPAPAPGAAGGSSGGAPAGGGNAGAGPGRVGAELCPAGPFGSPLANGAPTPELLASVGDNNFFIFEGPVWTGSELFISEIANGNASQIDRFVPGVGLERGVVADTGSNGLALDASGNLLLAAHDVGGISSVALATSSVTRGTQTRNGARFNSPNDLVVRGDGNIYFTDPDFQAPNGRTQEGTFVYRIAPAGEISVVDDSMSNPNGITLSPDGNTLYASGAGVLREYALDAAGAATPVGDVTNQIGTPDGMTADCAGNIYAADNGGRAILVFSPEGEQLGTIGGQAAFAQGVTNVAFGGPNRTTLFITTFSQGTSGGLYSVELGVPGMPY
jgi:gluconolactonase